MTTSPIAGATGPYLDLWTTGTGTFWVRVSNPLGVADSNAATLSFATWSRAVYDPVLQAPRCALGSLCTSDNLLDGRGVVTLERNQPNTIFSACPDGSAGQRGEETIKSLALATIDLSPLAPGKRVRITAHVQPGSSFFDSLDLYHAADATNPSWTHITTFRVTREFLWVEFTLPFGPLQAIRGRLRYQGSPDACGPGGPGSYDDHDDLIFATASPAVMPPVIVVQPSSQLAPQAQPVTLNVMAAGPSLTYQWYRGTSGDTTNPLPGQTTATLEIQPPQGSTPYWVQVSAAGGVVNSATAIVKTIVAAAAVYDQGIRAPVCLPWTASCDSMGVLLGRGTLGPEAGAPNTIGTPCPDGPAGRFHVDESIDRMRVFTLDGEPFAPGRVVKLEVTAWIFSERSDVVDVFYSPTASNPTWTFLASLMPMSGGQQTLSTGYVLPSGDLQAVRARLRYRGSPGPCGTGQYDDHDDLVFAVGASVGPTSTTTTSVSSMTMPGPSHPLDVQSPALWGYAHMPGLAAEAVTATRVDTRERSDAASLRDGHGDSLENARYDQALAPIDAARPDAAESPIRSLAQVEPPVVEFDDPRSFTLTYGAVPGGGAIAYTEVWFKNQDETSRLDRTCMVYLEKATNTVLLGSDDGRSLLSGTVGTDATLANTQCSVDLRSVRLQSTSTGLVMSMSVRFNPQYEPAPVYVRSVAADGASSEWTKAPDPGQQSPVNGQANK